MFRYLIFVWSFMDIQEVKGVGVRLSRTFHKVYVFYNINFSSVVF